MNPTPYIPSPDYPAKNYKGLVDMFGQIVQDTSIIQSYAFGSFREKLIENETLFPQLYLECLPFNYDWINGATLRIPVVFYILDLAETSQDEMSGNNLDIQSKIEQIARNVIVRIETTYSDWFASEYLNPNFLMDKLSTSKVVKYCRVEFTVDVPYGLGSCELPFEPRTFPDDDCE